MADRGDMTGLALWRLTLVQRSPTLTPWQADTIFGSLCWAIARRHGSARVEGFLRDYDVGTPPLVVSNGFARDLLPAPLVPRPRQTGLTRAQERRLREEAKRLKSKTYLPREAFLHACQRRDVRADLVNAPVDKRDSLHNTVSRHGTGTVADGGLYSVTELWPRGLGAGADAEEIVIYALVRDDYTEMIGQALDAFTAAGYGRRATVGYGQIDLTEWEKTDALAVVLPGANGFVALSNFCPAAGDPTQGYYRTIVKYGRLGEERGTQVSPFKRPLIQIVAGSCFYTPDGGPPRPYYGRLVRGIHPVAGEVVQHGLTLAVPIALPPRHDQAPGA